MSGMRGTRRASLSRSPAATAWGVPSANVRRMQRLWAPWRMAYVSGEDPAAGGCFLCRAGAGDDGDDGLVVERAAHTVTMANRFPYSSGHMVVAPRRHATALEELSAEEGAAILAATQRVIAALFQVMRPEGFNVGFNLGRAAGASVEHLHLHVVPRWGGDTNFMPVLADVKVLPEHLEVTASRVREALRAPSPPPPA